MKILCIVLFFFLFCYFSFSQDTIKNKEKKLTFSVQANGFYKTFFGNKYVEPDPDNNYSQYARFTKTPTHGFEVGLLYTYKIHKNWFLISGLLFCRRKNIYENNQDTVIKYGNSSGIRNIYNTLEYDYTYSSIEIPILLSFKLKKINFYTGIELPALTFYKATYTYVINQFPQNPNWITSQKTITGVDIPLVSIPSLFPSIEIQFSPLQVNSFPASPKINYDMPIILATLGASYECQIKNYSINPFLGIDIGSKKSLYVQGGITFPLTKKGSHPNAASN